MVGTSGQATAPFNDRNVSLEALAESEQRSRTLVETYLTPFSFIAKTK